MRVGEQDGAPDQRWEVGGADAACSRHSLRPGLPLYPPRTSQYNGAIILRAARTTQYTSAILRDLRSTKCYHPTQHRHLLSGWL